MGDDYLVGVSITAKGVSSVLPNKIDTTAAPTAGEARACFTANGDFSMIFNAAEVKIFLCGFEVTTRSYWYLKVSGDSRLCATSTTASRKFLSIGTGVETRGVLESPNSNTPCPPACFRRRRCGCGIVQFD